MAPSLRALSKVWLALVLLGSCGGKRGTSPGSDAGSTPSFADAGSEVAAAPDVASASDREAGGTGDAIDGPVQLCGNSRLDPGEGCDDGNVQSGDGCTSRCQIEDPWPPCPGGFCVSISVCGNGVVSASEICDDGNATSGDGCPADCQQVEPGWRCRSPGRRCTPICGDRILKGTETCDDGNTQDGDGCSVYCLTEPGWDCSGGTCVPVASTDGGFAGGVDGGMDGGVDGGVLPRCGDGILSGAEECDLGSDNGDGSYGGCNSRCFFGGYCGDGIANGPEECDLGDSNGHVVGKGGCTVGCTNTHYCGDGLVDTSLGEECDLGEANGKRVDGNGNPTSGEGGLLLCTTECRLAWSGPQF